MIRSTKMAVESLDICRNLKSVLERMAVASQARSKVRRSKNDPFRRLRFCYLSSFGQELAMDSKLGDNRVFTALCTRDCCIRNWEL